MQTILKSSLQLWFLFFPTKIKRKRQKEKKKECSKNKRNLCAVEILGKERGKVGLSKIRYFVTGKADF